MLAAAPREGTSGGLARVGAEGELDIDYRFEDNHLSIAVETKFREEATQ